MDLGQMTCPQLKEVLRRLELPATGLKAELICRLRDADVPEEQLEAAARSVCQESARDKAEIELLNVYPDQMEDTAYHPRVEEQNSSLAQLQRENELLRRERNLAEREREVAQMQLELLRESQQRRSPGAVDGGLETTTRAPRMNISAVGELLGAFDGAGDSFERWERQVSLLRSTYGLGEDECRILMGSRLKGKAMEWFHSKPDHLRMSCAELLREMQLMFHHQPGAVARRRAFEQRTWRRGEYFSDYLHDKVILANRVPVAETEMVEHVVEGIPDPVLRDQARLQRFRDLASMSDAFSSITLRGGASSGTTAEHRIGAEDQRRDREGPRRQETSSASALPWCRNCGGRGHTAAGCHHREKGTKCFECQQFGHISARCPKRQPTVNSAHLSPPSSPGKYTKAIYIGDCELNALIDTGSDLCLMQAKAHKKIGAPRLQCPGLRFRGIGSNLNSTQGEFLTQIRVDGETYPVKIRVISDDLMSHSLILGADFLTTVDVALSGQQITIKTRENAEIAETAALPDVLRIECDPGESRADVSYISNAKAQIAKTQAENAKSYNRRRRITRGDKKGDLVAIRRTQSRPRVESTPKILGPYSIERVLRNGRYVVRRIGEHERLLNTIIEVDDIKDRGFHTRRTIAQTRTTRKPMRPWVRAGWPSVGSVTDPRADGLNCQHIGHRPRVDDQGRVVNNAKTPSEFGCRSGVIDRQPCVLCV